LRVFSRSCKFHPREHARGGPLHASSPSRPIDLRLTLGPLNRGRGDPSTRFDEGSFLRATRTPDGPASEAVSTVPGGVLVRAWGPGAAWLLDAAPALLGADDDPSVLVAHHLLVSDLARLMRGLRLGRSGAVMEALVPAILEQKVTGTQAHRGFAGLVRAFGEAAPGPLGWCAAGRPRRVPYHGYHRPASSAAAETVRRVARGRRLERWLATGRRSTGRL
jgi:hypothetical protein